MSSQEEHLAAIDALNESEVGGRTIYVSESLPKEKVAENKRKYKEQRKSKLTWFDSIFILLLCVGVPQD